MSQLIDDHIFLLPCRQMGYRSPEHMLSSMSEAFRFFKLPNGQSIVQGKPDLFKLLYLLPLIFFHFSYT